MHFEVQPKTFYINSTPDDIVLQNTSILAHTVQYLCLARQKGVLSLFQISKFDKSKFLMCLTHYH